MIYKERKNNGRSMMEENQWKMMGDSCIYADDSFGHSISTSSNGKVIAISAPNNGSGFGFVRIMSYNPMTNSFVQRGNEIQGEYFNDRLGTSISLSSNGSIIAIGTDDHNNENGFRTGNVRVFIFDGPNNDWVQIGNSILGQSENEYLGHSVELSNDGKTVLIGSFTYLDHTKRKVGVFTFDADTQNWLQKGTNLNGIASIDGDCGRSLALSRANANIVAVGCPGSSSVKMYEYDSSSNDWTQINELEGLASDGKFGHAVSLSDDGAILAVGSPTSGSVAEPIKGHVEIFKYNESTHSWDQIGYIPGESERDESGAAGAVSLSSDGKIVSIGAKFNDNGGEHSGHVRVFEYDEFTGNWIQLGSDVVGLEALAYFGRSVSLSSDGMIFAASSHKTNSGYVCVYSYLPLSLPWTQVGQNIYGSSSYEDSGLAVSLSSDGKTVAVGSPSGDNYKGFVRVFSLDTSSSNWIQKGNNIEGENMYDYSGDSLSLSGNGQVVALGSRQNSDAALVAGHVRVFLYDSGIDTFNQIGSDIDGESEFDNAGTSMSLSENGMIIAVGSPQVGGYPNPGGEVRVFSYDASSNAWQKIGNSISGESAWDKCGNSVSISSDGSRVAMGSPGQFSGGGTKYSGQVRIFSYDSSSDQWVQVGQSIDGDDYDFIGWSVSLSNDGDSVAIGSSGSRGGSVYRLNPSSQSWVQVGDTPLASDDDDYYYCGWSVSLSGDGQTLGVGCYGGHWSIGDAGYVRIYTYVASLDEFKQVGSKIIGEEAFEQSGASISLSEDGTIVAIGSPYNNGANGDEYLTGLTRIFYGYGIPYLDDGPGPTPDDGPNAPSPNPPVSGPDSPPESPSSVTVSPPDTSAPSASPSSSGTADCVKSNLMKLLYSKLIRQ